MNGLIEYIILNSCSLLEDDFYVKGKMEEFIQTLPFGETASYISNTEESSVTPNSFVMFRTKKVTLDDFLLSKFNINFFKFMQIYTKLHTEDQGFTIPTPSTILCMFFEENNFENLREKICYPEHFLTKKISKSIPSITDSSKTTFTLIKCTNCNFEANHIEGAYHYVTKSFNFFISATSNFELTVAYEEKRAAP